jgi:NADP-dependent 3-hydroxy acid dehydrogenase YdfG
VEKLAVGTREYLLVDVKDRLSTLTTLDGLAITFDVKDRDGTNKYTAAAATNVGMIVRCLVDTAGWTAGKYSLWVNIVVGPETPRLGPFDFEVA